MSLRAWVVCIAVAVAGCGSPPIGCDPASCGGCCQGDICVDGTSNDACGTGVACVACGDGTSCAGGVCAPACVPESDEDFCAGAECGVVDAVDNCGVRRAISCGACAAHQTCGGGGTPHECGCTSETNFAFCARLGSACDSLTAPDNCGLPRTIVCGTCAGADVCDQHRCECVAETDAELCAQAGHGCGALSVKDRCGATRTVASCGSCSGSNQCTQGVCACATTESDYAFCARLGAACGAVSGKDLCGNSRSASVCGYCSAPKTCGGSSTANQCGCTGESDAAFCTAHATSCGPVAAYDNCGLYRNVTSCGTCTTPQTCGAGVCSCTAETNAQFCTRLGKTCGSVAATDNCGTPRTVTCGACTTPQSCGGGGAPNVCGCTGETAAQLCTKNGTSCGAATVIDACNVSRTVACGGCSGAQVCGANGVVGQCGTVSVPTAAQTGNRFVSVAPQFLDDHITAIRAVSPTEVWIAGPRNLVRWKNGIAQPYYPGVFYENGVTRLWSSSPSDVWFSTNYSLFHFDGTTWTKKDPGFAANSLIRAIGGTASDDVWVAAILSGSSDIRHFDGTNFVPWVAPPSGVGPIDDIVAVTRGMPWISQGYDIFRWNGLSYATLPASTQPTNIRRLWISPTGTLFALSNQDDDAGHFLDSYDGTKWTNILLDYEDYASAPYADQANIDGASDGNVWFGDSVGGAHRTDGKPMSGFMMSSNGGAQFSADSQRLYEWVNGRSVVRFDTGVAPHCNRAFADGAGGAWLSCSGQLGRWDGSHGFSLTAASSAITAIFAGPSTSLWVALDTGAIEQRSASGTVVHNGYLGSNFVGISAITDSNVWAVTSDGGALHWDGSKWSTSLIPSGYIEGIKVSTSTIWAWGSASLYKWSGSTWSTVTLPAGVSIWSLVVYNDVPWIVANSASSQSAWLSWSAGAWKTQRANNVYQAGWSAGGPVTLSWSYSNASSTVTFERWQDSGPTTLGTFNDASTFYETDALCMPTTSSVLYTNGTNVYLSSF